MTVQLCQGMPTSIYRLSWLYDGLFFWNELNMSLIGREIIKPYYYKTIFCDTETTGLKPWLHGIVDIAAVVSDLDGNTKDIFQSYCNPGPDVIYEPIALKVNGLSREFIEEQPPIRDVLIDFVEFMNSHLTLKNPNAKVNIVGNNFGFDAWFFQFAFDKHVPDLEKYTKWMFRRVDEMKGLVRATLPNVKHISQDALGKLLGIPNERLHGAMGDVKQMQQIYFKLMEINERRILLDLKDNALIGV
jgi:DNA polymerase III epsilon subunit-like protein